MGGKWAWPPRRRHMDFGIQTQPKSWLTGYTFWVNHYLEIVFSKISVVNPPPPPPPPPPLNQNGHNFSHPISTFFKKSNSDKMNNQALFYLVHNLVFTPVFAPRPHMGTIVRMDPKLPSKCRDVSWSWTWRGRPVGGKGQDSWSSPPTPSSKSVFPM